MELPAGVIFVLVHHFETDLFQVAILRRINRDWNRVITTQFPLMHKALNEFNNAGTKIAEWSPLAVDQYFRYKLPSYDYHLTAIGHSLVAASCFLRGVPIPGTPIFSKLTISRQLKEKHRAGIVAGAIDKLNYQEWCSLLPLIRDVVVDTRALTQRYAARLMLARDDFTSNNLDQLTFLLLQNKVINIDARLGIDLIRRYFTEFLANSITHRAVVTEWTGTINELVFLSKWIVIKSIDLADKCIEYLNTKITDLEQQPLLTLSPTLFTGSGLHVSSELLAYLERTHQATTTPLIVSQCNSPNREIVTYCLTHHLSANLEWLNGAWNEQFLYIICRLLDPADPRLTEFKDQLAKWLPVAKYHGYNSNVLHLLLCYWRFMVDLGDFVIFLQTCVAEAYKEWTMKDCITLTKKLREIDNYLAAKPT